MAKLKCKCGDAGDGTDPNGPRHFKVVRMFRSENRSTRTIKSGLTLAEAQAHCHDAETSSRTASSARALRYTERNGPWFDGYDHI
jgi:hypothetical protein